jgi:carbon monoxide dehydrogenase subunit G
MRLEQNFVVPVRVEQAWGVLLDVEGIAPCLPGASLTGFDGDSFTGTVRVKLGPVSLTYQGKGHFVARDEVERRVMIEASGRDSHGAGTVATTVTASLYPDEAGTRVEVVTDLQITGRPAQFGRGMIADVSGKLLGQFAECLAERLAPVQAPAEARSQAPARVSSQPASADVEPVDLLAVTGAGDALRRLAPYAIGLLVGIAASWIVRRLRR